MFRDLLSRVCARGRDRVRRNGNGFGVRGPSLLALASLLAASPAAWALGLGEIHLNSNLNEKLDAQIELLDAQGLQPTEVIVSLASPKEFDQVGVERFYYLTDLHFEVESDKNGLHDIRVTSNQPVTEPYLDFLVQVLWPNGKLLKEYTVLLDPPTYSPAPAAAVSAPARSAAGDAGAGRVERGTTTVQSGTQVQLSSAGSPPSSPLDQGVVDGEYRMTDRSDTLWSIASRTRPSPAVSVQQNMLAIQRLNPTAFLHDNINLLKAGYSLRLPTEQDALSVAAAEANRQVSAQNDDWRAIQRGEPVPSRQPTQVAATAAPAGTADQTAQPKLQAQVDATPAKAAPEATAPATDQGELRIVAGKGDSATGSGATGKLDAALEEQDRLNREVQSLNEQLASEKDIAANQIAVKDRQLEVKDQQIAEMQAQLAHLRDQMEQAQAAAGQKQNQSASANPPWWQSPYVLFGAVGVVVLLLVYALMAARRRRAEEQDFYDEVEAADDGVAPAMAAPAETAAFALANEPAEELSAEDEPDAVAAADLSASEERAAEPEQAASSETGDVIGEADIYIAYGRYPQAIGLLLGVLEEDPNRNDVRLKLLELYAETRDRDAFDTHMAELLERCDDEEALLTARELGAEFGENGAAQAEPGRAEEEEALDLEALTAGDDLDTELELEGVEPPAAAADDALEAEDFELELDDFADAGGATGTSRAGDDLGGDLGLDFDPDRQRNGTTAAPLADTAQDLDLADELMPDAGVTETQREAAAPVPAAAGVEELESVDDLDLDLDLDDAEMLGDEAFEFADEGDTASTKLDLARAYIDMGDEDGARDILNEVVAEGNAEQQQRAHAMLEEL